MPSTLCIVLPGVLLKMEMTNTVTQEQNKAGYTATLVACGLAGAVKEKVIGAFGQERRAQNAQKR